jgi:hypothetical protein
LFFFDIGELKRWVVKEGFLVNYVGLSQIVKENCSSYKVYLKQILEQQPVLLGKIKNSEKFLFPGVYIATFHESVQWVGRTQTKTVNGRLEDHRTGHGTSDLNKIVGKECLEYGIRAIEIEDHRERIFVEHLFLAMLKPALNKA